MNLLKLSAFISILLFSCQIFAGISASVMPPNFWSETNNSATQLFNRLWWKTPQPTSVQKPIQPAKIETPKPPTMNADISASIIPPNFWSETNNSATQLFNQLWWKTSKPTSVQKLIQPAKIEIPKPPTINADRSKFIFTTAYHLDSNEAPNIKNKSFTVTADLFIPNEGAEGILVTQGGRYGGWGLFIQDRKVIYVYNDLDKKRYLLISTYKFPSGKKLFIKLNYVLNPTTSEAVATLYMNDKKAGEIKIKVPFNDIMTDNENFDVGEDTGTPVLDTYVSPFKFTGKINRIALELNSLAEQIINVQVKTSN